MCFIELNNSDYTDKELQEFFEKFSYDSIESFDLILYFSSFSSNISDLIERLKKAKEIVSKAKIFEESKRTIEHEISFLSKKQLELLTGLLDEAISCASSDGRYQEEFEYMSHLSNVTDDALDMISCGRKRKK